jgi:hypothetical protein
MHVPTARRPKAPKCEQILRATLSLQVALRTTAARRPSSTRPPGSRRAAAVLRLRPPHLKHCRLAIRRTVRKLPRSRAPSQTHPSPTRSGSYIPDPIRSHPSTSLARRLVRLRRQVHSLRSESQLKIAAIAGDCENYRSAASRLCPDLKRCTHPERASPSSPPPSPGLVCASRHAVE